MYSYYEMHFLSFFIFYKLDTLITEFQCSSHKAILRLQKTVITAENFSDVCYSLTKQHFDKTDLEISKGNQFEINARAKTGLKIQSS